ncbi:receptor-type tyrosine-protein phosphatase gamma-like [Patiria miniata]|uniref:carbonic anhydrase n=1 Tax=Patiria miniata TaxID=46514 RepID=A0A914ARG3_PATMI|nr:receptor-type tyrosine-protein phosphatase gamma-like [Patiria miniata]
MMMLVWTVTGLLLVTHLVDVHGNGYCYGEGPKGPQHWSKTYPKCAAKYQSPIDISENDTTEVQHGSLTFEGFFKKDRKPYDKDWRVVNNGKQLYILISNKCYISGGGLQGKHSPYVIFFQWGRVNGRGSEHKLDGKFYDGEIKLMCHQQPGTNKVSGFVAMVKVVEQDNPLLYELMYAVNKVKYADDEASVSPHDNLADMLSPDLGNFYRYQGSQTWPQCNTDVTWTVWRTPLEMGRAQMEVFRGLYNKKKGTRDNIHIGDNVRPLQPREGRKIEYNPQHNYRTQVEASI